LIIGKVIIHNTFFLIITLVSSIVRSQTHEDLYNKLGLDALIVLQVETKLRSTLLEVVPSVDSKKWRELTEDIDYSLYKKKVLKAFKDNFTLEDVKEIFEENKKRKSLDNRYVFSLKGLMSDKFKQELFFAAGSFGQNLMIGFFEKLGKVKRLEDGTIITIDKPESN